MSFLRTEYDPKPIPIRDCDWSAWVDGYEEWGSGYGLTEKQAINALEELITNMCWCTERDVQANRQCGACRALDRIYTERKTR